ncbi:MAG: response regulator [Armatimonadia bacterium]|nr:response regulator [Armatimonadia bacterium]
MGLGQSCKRLVIIADDEPLMRELVESLLDAAGYHVRQAADASELFEAVDEFAEEIALLVVDVSMPGITGPEAVEQIREHHEEMPVLYLSGHDAGLLGKLYTEPGLTGAVQKPFEAADLLGAIDQLLNDTPAGDGTA